MQKLGVFRGMQDDPTWFVSPVPVEGKIQSSRVRGKAESQINNAKDRRHVFKNSFFLRTSPCPRAEAEKMHPLFLSEKWGFFSLSLERVHPSRKAYGTARTPGKSFYINKLLHTTMFLVGDNMAA
jgi:hypothetical protein